jgi:hypothetical protein
MAKVMFGIVVLLPMLAFTPTALADPPEGSDGGEPLGGGTKPPLAAAEVPFGEIWKAAYAQVFDLPTDAQGDYLLLDSMPRAGCLRHWPDGEPIGYDLTIQESISGHRLTGQGSEPFSFVVVSWRPVTLEDYCTMADEPDPNIVEIWQQIGFQLGFVDGQLVGPRGVINAAMLVVRTACDCDCDPLNYVAGGLVLSARELQNRADGEAIKRWLNLNDVGVGDPAPEMVADGLAGAVGGSSACNDYATCVRRAYAQYALRAKQAEQRETACIVKCGVAGPLGILVGCAGACWAGPGFCLLCMASVMVAELVCHYSCVTDYSLAVEHAREQLEFDLTWCGPAPEGCAVIVH